MADRKTGERYANLLRRTSSLKTSDDWIKDNEAKLLEMFNIYMSFNKDQKTTFKDITRWNNSGRKRHYAK